MNRPLFVIALGQAKRIKRQAQELADLSRAYQRAIRTNHRMADNLATANRERDEAIRDAELLFEMLPKSRREGAIALVSCRRIVDSIETEAS